MIFVTNILTIVTFKRMRELQLQHYLIICLAVVDLVTVLPALPGAFRYLQGYLVLNNNLCLAIAVSNHSVFAATTWIHYGICIDKCISVKKRLMHRQFVTKFKPHRLASCCSATIVILMIALILGITLTGVIKAVFNPTAATCMYAVDLPYVLSTCFIFISLMTALVTHVLILCELGKAGLIWQKRIKGVIKTTLLLVGIYYACWLRYSV